MKDAHISFLPISEPSEHGFEGATFLNKMMSARPPTHHLSTVFQGALDREGLFAHR